MQDPIPQHDQEVDDALWNDPYNDDNHYRIRRLSTWSASSDDDASAYRFKPHQSNTCMFIRADSLRPFNSYSLEAPGRSATLTYGQLSIAAIASSNSADLKKEAVEKPPRNSLSMFNQLWRRKSKAQLLSAAPLPLSPPPPQPVSIKTMLLRTMSRFKFGAAAAAEKDTSGPLKDRGGLSTTITSVFRVSKT